ncbi:tubulin alpha chain-like [Aethina tumida]|uniref:tubulin alpha chain-like n=1 Tax=Aethina tumida TaxID=116153 RepID=UPI00096AE9F3|nr:tubulin alpha chain-like [Aethina tumida]
MPKREIIQIHIGQAGVQIASACWELFCLEHGITVDGHIHPSSQCYRDDSYQSYFSITNSGKAVPRTLIVDLEPTAVDEIRTNYYRHLFRPGTLITGKEDAANNFAIGNNTRGLEMLPVVLDSLRQLSEEANNPEGFIIFKAFGGGTGSGFTSLLLRGISEDYRKISVLEFGIYPSPRVSPIIVEPYNAGLATHSSMEYEDCCCIFDNEALYSILERKLEVRNPTYTNPNRLIAQVVSATTAGLRFNGSVNVSLQEIQTNLIPYPRIHYPLVTYSPMLAPHRSGHEQATVSQITNSCFEPSNFMVHCDPRQGSYISCCCSYRGNVTGSEVNNAMANIKAKRSINFVDYVPGGFKVGICYMPPVTVPGGDLAASDRACVMMANHTAIRQAWERLAHKYKKLYEKRAFFHHYIGEGMEEGEFADCLENLKSLVSDYKEVDSK